MKTRITLLILIFLLWSSLAWAQSMTVAVLNFEILSSHGGGYVQKAADWLTNELSQKKIQVVERKRLDALIQEQAFQHSGNVDPRNAAEIGKMLGADIVVNGTINKLGVSKNTVRVGDSTITRYNSVAEVSIRAINVKTGAILFSDSGESSAQAKSASVPDFGMGNKAPSVDGPLKSAIQKVAGKLVQVLKGTPGTPGAKPKISIL
jgi:curli biogenesis system outer membrane secretion channel CsgG